MSPLGYQWIGRCCNMQVSSVERVFLPDDIETWRQSKNRFTVMKPKHHFLHFPVVGVSLAYELEIAGLVQCLQLAGIPLFRRDRSEYDPRITLGGPLTFSNPLPTSFVDAILLGEVEDVVVEVFDAVFESNRETLDRIQKLSGGFVPERQGTQLPPIAKASDMMLPARSHIITPDAELKKHVFNRRRKRLSSILYILCDEKIYKWYEIGHSRKESCPFIPEHAQRVGLVGVAISDHPKLPELLEKIIDSGREVA